MSGCEAEAAPLMVEAIPHPWTEERFDNMRSVLGSGLFHTASELPAASMTAFGSMARRLPWSSFSMSVAPAHVRLTETAWFCGVAPGAPPEPPVEPPPQPAMTAVIAIAAIGFREFTRVGAV